MTDSEFYPAIAPSAGGVSRRALVKSAAWATPVIVLAAAAPGAAASTTTCTPGPVAAAPVAQWTVTGALASWDAGNTGWLPDNSEHGHAQANWLSGITNDDGFLSSGDNANSTDTTLTVTYSFPVVAGAQYSVELLTSVGRGNGSRALQWVQVMAQSGTEVAVLAQVVTGGEAWDVPVGASAPAGYEVQNYNNSSSKVARTGTFTAGSGAEVGTITYRFTLAGLPTPKPTSASLGDVNDDMWVSAPVVTLTACPTN